MNQVNGDERVMADTAWNRWLVFKRMVEARVITTHEHLEKSRQRLLRAIQLVGSKIWEGI